MCNKEQNNKSESLGQCRLSWKEKKKIVNLKAGEGKTILLMTFLLCYKLSKAQKCHLLSFGDK